VGDEPVAMTARGTRCAVATVSVVIDKTGMAGSVRGRDIRHAFQHEPDDGRAPSRHHLAVDFERAFGRSPNSGHRPRPCAASAAAMSLLGMQPTVHTLPRCRPRHDDTPPAAIAARYAVNRQCRRR
jgi:hypothetical protein